MDATLKEVNIKRSIKKFFIDGFPNISVYFERQITSSQMDKGPSKWINILLEGLTPRHVSEAQLFIYAFTRNDVEGENISELRDSILELLESGRIPLYDTYQSPWEHIGGLFVIQYAPGNLIYNPDQSKLLTLNHIIKWGTVWS